jgi:hypothetical protein
MESWLSEFDAAMQHLGSCEIHEILYVELDPTNKKGCPRCEQEKSSSNNCNV